jgi:hypothetical protein
MTPLQIINAAMVSRGMEPLTFVCPCCGGNLDREDRAQYVDFTTSDAMLDRWGEMPCHACADTVRECTECGKATFPGDRDYRDGGFCSGRCGGEYDRRPE